MQRIFQALLLSAISMMVTVGANAHEQCKISPVVMGAVCGVNPPPCYNFIKGDAAACFITQSVIVDTDCENCASMNHTRDLTVVHPTFGYAQCSIRQNVKFEQAMMCQLFEFGHIP